MKKVILKRIADAFEKMAIGSAIIGIFQQNALGVYVGAGCMVASIFFTIWEAKK